jgi:hypothetical protein
MLAAHSRTRGAQLEVPADSRIRANAIVNRGADPVRPGRALRRDNAITSRAGAGLVPSPASRRPVQLPSCPVAFLSGHVVLAVEMPASRRSVIAEW